MKNLIYSFKAKKFRKAISLIDQKRDQGQITPENVIRFDNILYGPDKKLKKWQYLDVYRPKENPDIDSNEERNNSASPSTSQAPGSPNFHAQTNQSPLKKLPVIVIVHGGAWIYGDKDVYQFYGMKLCQRGFAVVNYSYRIAPEAKFPSSLQDTDNVFTWILQNAQKYGFDTQNIFAAGDSAGAHLLAMYASAITNPEFAKNFPFIKNNKLKLRAIALNCGKYTMNDALDGNKDAKMQMAVWMPNKGSKKEFELVNLPSHITSNFPPSFVMTCKGDFLLEQAPLMLKALKDAGVTHQFKCYGTEEKPLWHVFHCDPNLPEALICNDDECNFFKKLCIKSDE